MNIELEVSENLLSDFNTLKDELRSYIEREVNEVKIPRATNKLITDTIKDMLTSFINSNSNISECYYVKNITPETNICFVHQFSKEGKKFQNLDLSTLPADVKIGDVLYMEDSAYKIHRELTAQIQEAQDKIIDNLNVSEELFKVEGNEYFVCDKSDEVSNPKISLRIESTSQEFWGIPIDAELYNKIKFGSIVKYTNGKYILQDK